MSTLVSFIAEDRVHNAESEESPAFRQQNRGCLKEPSDFAVYASFSEKNLICSPLFMERWAGCTFPGVGKGGKVENG